MSADIRNGSKVRSFLLCWGLCHFRFIHLMQHDVLDMPRVQLDHLPVAFPDRLDLQARRGGDRRRVRREQRLHEHLGPVRQVE